MKKFMAIVFIIISFIILYLLQVNFFSWFTIAGVKPNLFVIFVLVLGLFAGKKVGTIMGLILGILLDILVGKSVGMSGFIFMIIGFTAGYLDKTFSKESKITIIVTAIIGTVVFEIIIYIYNVIKFNTLFELLSFSKILAIELIFNILLTIILHPTIQILGNKLEKIFNQKEVLTRYF